MPEIKVIYWNIESFGDDQGGKRDYTILGNFIAQVMVNTDADVLCLMELRQRGIGGAVGTGGPATPIGLLHAALNNAFFIAGRQQAEWYFDWVKGATSFDFFGAAPFSPNMVGFTGSARLEGYAVFWKQNIAKFIMQEADPIDVVAANRPGGPVPAAGTIPNTQSRSTYLRGNPAYLPLAANLTVPVAAGNNQFTIPTGTTIPAAGINRAHAAAIGAGVLGGPQPLAAGDTIPTGTIIGQGGLILTAAVNGVNPVVVPEGYTLTEDLDLPAVGDTIIPQHVVSLVMVGRQTAVNGDATDYAPLGPNNWSLIHFPSTAGANLWNGGRRPAFCTIRTNSGGVGANDLVPIVFYHAPLASPESAMTKMSLSQVAYEAYDHAVGPAYVRNARALLGGDLNLRLDINEDAYTSFSNNIAGPGGVNGGVGCVDGAGNPLFRVLQPAPVGAPAFPPTALPLTEADNPENKSTIQLNHPVIAGNAVLSNNLDHFRRLAIDNIFYRGFTALQSPRQTFFATPAAIGAQQTFMADLYDLMAAVSDVVPPGAGVPMIAGVDNFFIPPGIVQQFNLVPSLVSFLAAAIGMAPAIPPPHGLGSCEDPGELLNDIILGQFLPAAGGDPAAGAGPYTGPGGIATITPQRRAAEFIKLFISDHLPVIFTMDI